MKQNPSLCNESVTQTQHHLLANGLARARAPFQPEAIQFKVQSASKTKALVVPFAGVRTYIARLNDVWGGSWSDEYYPGAQNELWCHLTVGGVKRIDVGEGTGKAAVSDALKRACVKFEIGAFLYAMPKLFLDLNSDHVTQRGDKTFITYQGEQFLRGNYVKWLTKDGRVFGEPHGIADQAADETEPVVEPSISVPEALGLADKLKALGLSSKQVVEMLQNVGVDMTNHSGTRPALEKSLLALTQAQAAAATKMLTNMTVEKGGEK